MKTSIIPSTDGKNTLYSVSNEVVSPKASIQVIHGMNEHIQRYRKLFNYGEKKGILVFGHDHLGHGQTGSSEDRSHLEPGAMDSIIADIKVVSNHFRGSETHIKLGHSMGSFILRSYLARYPEDSFDGAIIMGTAYQKKPLLKAGIALASMISKTRGKEHRSKLLYQMSEGSYAKRLPHAKSELDWLSSIDQVIEDYREDPLVGDTFTASAYRELYRLLLEVNSPEKLQSMRKDMPILFMSGRRDPVGDMGRGVHMVKDMFNHLGMEEVKCILYPQVNHEILNDIHSSRVLDDIAVFIEHLKGENIV